MRQCVVLTLLMLCLCLVAAVRCDSFDVQIAGGRDAMPAEFPFAVGIRQKSGSRLLYCGAALITENVILTAAHCFDEERASDIHVIVGRVNPNDESTGEVINVERIHVHENYKSVGDSLHNDIALAVLAKNVTFSKYVQRIFLNKVAIPERTMMTLYGWGYTSPANRQPNTLQTVQVSTVPHLQCQNTFTGYSPELMLCAGLGDGKDSCMGDSGGSMVYESEGLWFTSGIVSTGGMPCGGKGVFGVYTQVSTYIQWINATLGYTYRDYPYVDLSGVTLPKYREYFHSEESSKASAPSKQCFALLLLPLLLMYILYCF